MRIVSVAYPFAPVSRDAVGGAEQVLAAMDAALVAAGHRSIVIAVKQSSVADTLLPLPADGDTSDAGRATQHAAVRRALATALPDADLVHLHGVDFADYLPPGGLPVVVTLHLPPAWYSPAALSPVRPRTHLICVSHSQRLACPEAACIAATVPNGVPVAALAGAARAPRCYALMLGRVCPEKGQHLALDAAIAAGVPLLLGGEVFSYPAHKAYFAREVVPRLDRTRRFLGPLGFARKRRLLAGARCLLVPSLAAETSSLVAMEALACGTPVIAFEAGALPEIVAHGRTGFIVRDTAGMAAAIAASGQLDRAACRAEAAERFAEQRMTNAYLALYGRLLAA